MKAILMLAKDIIYTEESHYLVIDYLYKYFENAGRMLMDVQFSNSVGSADWCNGTTSVLNIFQE